MGSSKRFWVGMAFGAIAGGVVALFDKPTRQAVIEDFSKVSGTVAHVAKNPAEFIEDVKDTVNKVRTTVEQVTEDVAFITEKVEEIRDVPQEVTDLVKGTKEALGKIVSKSLPEPEKQ